jgi:hypothetical protein
MVMENKKDKMKKDTDCNKSNDSDGFFSIINKAINPDSSKEEISSKEKSE